MDPSRILVIDDDADIRDAMHVVLEQVGYQVLVAADGQEGLELARSSKPDLIITDVSMPRMDGLTLLAELRRDRAVSLPPVIVCSAFDRVAREALPLGAACVLPKPFERAALLLLVDNLLRNRPPDPEALERDRSYARSVRERAAEAARRARRRLEEQLQQPSEARAHLAHLAQWVADYFDLVPVVIAVVDDNGIRVAAVSRDCPVPVETRLSGDLLVSTGVLAANASLVLPDARLLGTRRMPDGRVVALGFLVAVPLLFEDTAIGVLALCGSEPRPFATEDLVSLEALGRSAASMLRPVGAVGNSLGLWPTLLLETVISTEMSHMHRERGAFDLLLVSAPPDGPGSDWALPLCAGSGPRFGVARRNGSTLAIFKRGPNPFATAQAVSRALSSLAKGTGPRAAGWVSIVAGRLPLVPANLALQLASRALDEAQAQPTAAVERIVLRGEEPPPAGAELG
jgi:DNA-binding response OmpR family regulator